MNESNKNQNENYKPQDNLNDDFKDNSLNEFSNLKDKFFKELKQTEEKLDKEFEEELDKQLNSNQGKPILKNTESEFSFENSYTKKLNIASQKREEALKKGSNKYIKYSSIGAEMIGSVLLGGFGGNWLDKKIELGVPIFTILFILLGLTLTFVHLIMQLNTDRKSEEEEAKKSKS